LNKDKLRKLDDSDADGAYADFYKRMKEMADDKRMSDKQFREILTKRAKGESEYKIWLSKKQRKYENFKITDRLHNERREKDLIKAKIHKEKELFEEDEAIEKAHIRSDKHVYNYQVRSVDQFMDDQIYFQQRKHDRIRALQDEKEVYEESLHPLHPEINPTSQKIIDYKKTMGESQYDEPERSLLETSKTNGIMKKKQRMQEILDE